MGCTQKLWSSLAWAQRSTKQVKAILLISRGYQGQQQKCAMDDVLVFCFSAGQMPKLVQNRLFCLSLTVCRVQDLATFQDDMFPGHKKKDLVLPPGSRLSASALSAGPRAPRQGRGRFCGSIHFAVGWLVPIWLWVKTNGTILG